MMLLLKQMPQIAYGVKLGGNRATDGLPRSRLTPRTKLGG
jgi:hypothetical protein